MPHCEGQNAREKNERPPRPSRGAGCFFFCTVRALGRTGQNKKMAHIWTHTVYPQQFSSIAVDRHWAPHGITPSSQQQQQYDSQRLAEKNQSGFCFSLDLTLFCLW